MTGDKATHSVKTTSNNFCILQLKDEKIETNVAFFISFSKIILIPSASFSLSLPSFPVFNWLGASFHPPWIYTTSYS